MIRSARILMAGLLFLGGCDVLEPAERVGVTGMVLTARGQPIPGGGVMEFYGVTGAQLKVTAEIGENGHFELGSVNSDGEYQPGVPEGMYRCIVHPGGLDSGFRPINLPQTYRVKKDMKLPIIVLVPRVLPK